MPTSLTTICNIKSARLRTPSPSIPLRRLKSVPVLEGWTQQWYEKGVTTFFRKDYQSVLDLTWASPQASARLSDFSVAYHLHSGSDHYPTTWQSSFSPLPPSNDSSYLFHDDNREAWESDFSATITHNWNLANLTTEIKNKDSLIRAVNVLMDSISEGSFHTCSHKPKSPRASKWFDKDTREALHIMRQDRQRAKIAPT